MSRLIRGLWYCEARMDDGSRFYTAPVNYAAPPIHRARPSHQPGETGTGNAAAARAAAAIEEAFG